MKIGFDDRDEPEIICDVCGEPITSEGIALWNRSGEQGIVVHKVRCDPRGGWERSIELAPLLRQILRRVS